MSAKEKIELDKMQFFLNIIFEKVQFCGHFGLPFPPVFPWFGMSCDVYSGTNDSGLTNLNCFTPVNLAL